MLDLQGSFSSFLNSLVGLLNDVLSELFGFLETLLESVNITLP